MVNIGWGFVFEGLLGPTHQTMYLTLIQLKAFKSCKSLSIRASMSQLRGNKTFLKKCLFNPYSVGMTISQSRSPRGKSKKWP